MASVGIAACFFINSISFGAVVISLFFIKPIATQIVKIKREQRMLPDIMEGLRYIKRNHILLATILVMIVVGTFAPNFSVLVPVFSTEILKQNEAGFGVLMSFMGVGSLFGALFIAAVSKSGPKRYVLYIVPLIVGALLIVVGYTNTYVFTALALAVTGFFFVAYSSNANSTMQLNTEDEYRGRVMSVYSLVFAGSTPIGSLYAGSITEKLGARIGFAACGAIILLLMMPIYVFLYRKTHR
jgi:predicted MFS family arabinose efflux permease